MSGNSVILIDIGNTSVTIGLGRGKRVGGIRRMPSYNSDNERKKLLATILGKIKPEGCVIASVVPSLTEKWTGAVKKMTGLKSMLVSHRMDIGVAIDYPRPSTIGADRLANASGAVARYGYPVIVADFGTALTFDIISGKGAYIGGVIAPGLPFMTDYLFEKTALLPRLRIGGKQTGIGKSTEHAMRIGAKFGYRGMVREITEHLIKQLGTKKVTLCATGGLARWALKGLKMKFHCDNDLTLFGLKCIYEMNRAPRRAKGLERGK